MSLWQTSFGGASAMLPPCEGRLRHSSVRYCMALLSAEPKAPLRAGHRGHIGAMRADRIVDGCGAALTPAVRRGPRSGRIACDIPPLLSEPMVWK